MRRALLVCGIVSSLLYVAMNVAAFGWGIWTSARDHRPLRTAGAL